MLPRLSTMALVLKGATPAHILALASARQIVGSWCLMRDLTPVQALTTLQVYWGGSENAVTTLAELIKHQVELFYAEEMAPPEARGQKIDGEPEGLIDICLSASLVSCAISGIIEADPDTEAVILDWWTFFCKMAKERTATAYNKETGTIIHQRLLPYTVERIRRYGKKKTKLQRKMDTISNRALRKKVKK